ncbi:MAG: phosphoglycerate dehydrogenase, partial [Bacteroidota bacterium]
DLVLALDRNLLEGACLDTLPIEDPQAWDRETMSGILAHPRLLLSPHVAGWTVESYRGISEVLAQKILAHLKEQGPV